MTPMRVGISGHRNLGGNTEFVALTLRQELARLREAHPEEIVAVSALAEGADTLFAEAALALGIPLEAVIPFQTYADDFSPGPARETYQRLLRQARTVHRLPYPNRSNKAYLEAGYWLVDHSDILIAVWDGQPPRGEGGTGHIVYYARLCERPLVLINPMTHAVREERTYMGPSMDKYDEYKFFAQSTQYLSDRRQAATGTYLTINTAIFTVLAFLVKDVQLHHWKLVIISLPLFIVGLLACWIWHSILTQYRRLIGWRYDQLQEIERSREMLGSHRFYVKEWEDFFKPQQGKKQFGFSRLEILLPRLFMALYVMYGIGLIIATAVKDW